MVLSEPAMEKLMYGLIDNKQSFSVCSESVVLNRQEQCTGPVKIGLV